jgi:hypothetical protein
MVVLGDRFWTKVRKDADGCWRWIAANNGVGYGHMYYEGAMRYSHRLAYEALIGPIPEGHDLDHLCRTRCCVNPAHLEAVTRRENLLRGEGLTARNAAATSCPQGHPYDEDNTYVYDGRRQCRTCRRLRNRKGKTWKRQT